MVNGNVTITGPLLRSDVSPRIHRAVTKIIREVSYAGEDNVQAQLVPGHGVQSGRFRFYVRGKLTKSLHGAIFAGDYVKGAWLEGTSSRNQTSRFKGYAMFRKGRDRTDKQVQAIGDAIFKGLVAELGG